MKLHCSWMYVERAELAEVCAVEEQPFRLVSKVHACICARIRFVLRPAMLAHLFITNLFNMCSLDFSF